MFNFLKKHQKKFMSLVLLATGALLKHGYDILGLKEDNAVEETVEEVIKDETGISIDLTPGTRELHIRKSSSRIER